MLTIIRYLNNYKNKKQSGLTKGVEAYDTDILFKAEKIKSNKLLWMLEIGLN